MQHQHQKKFGSRLAQLGFWLSLLWVGSPSLAQNLIQVTPAELIPAKKQNVPIKLEEPVKPVELDQKIILEMITPISPTVVGIPPAPLLISKDRAKKGAEDLYTAVQSVLATSDTQLTYAQLNITLDAYNNLVILLGLTERDQIENFPRLKSIGLALSSLQERISAAKPRK